VRELDELTRLDVHALLEARGRRLSCIGGDDVGFLHPVPAVVPQEC
jgi:hypothetical protein